MSCASSACQLCVPNHASLGYCRFIWGRIHHTFAWGEIHCNTLSGWLPVSFIVTWVAIFVILRLFGLPIFSQDDRGVHIALRRVVWPPCHASGPIPSVSWIYAYSALIPCLPLPLGWLRDATISPLMGEIVFELCHQPRCLSVYWIYAYPARIFSFLQGSLEGLHVHCNFPLLTRKPKKDLTTNFEEMY